MSDDIKGKKREGEREKKRHFFGSKELGHQTFYPNHVDTNQTFKIDFCFFFFFFFLFKLNRKSNKYPLLFWNIYIFFPGNDTDMHSKTFYFVQKKNCRICVHGATEVHVQSQNNKLIFILSIFHRISLSHSQKSFVRDVTNKGCFVLKHWQDFNHKLRWWVVWCGSSEREIEGEVVVMCVIGGSSSCMMMLMIVGNLEVEQTQKKYLEEKEKQRYSLKCPWVKEKINIWIKICYVIKIAQKEKSTSEIQACSNVLNQRNLSYFYYFSNPFSPWKIGLK